MILRSDMFNNIRRYGTAKFGTFSWSPAPSHSFDISRSIRISGAGGIFNVIYFHSLDPLFTITRKDTRAVSTKSNHEYLRDFQDIFFLPRRAIRDEREFVVVRENNVRIRNTIANIIRSECEN